MLGRKKLHVYLITHVIKKPFEKDIRETYHRIAKNDCRLVFDLQTYATVLYKEYCWTVYFAEIKRVDGSAINFSETINNHISGRHMLYRCPTPPEKSKTWTRQELSSKIEAYIKRMHTKNH